MADKNMEAQISVEFEEATSRQSLNSGETINTLWSKVKRWLSDLKAVAFSGSYKDLSDTPTTATKDTDGLMSAEDKTKLDKADDTYALKSKYGDSTINVGRNAGTTVGDYSTAEGYANTASGHYSHAEGNRTTASGSSSHAEGYNTTASGISSHAEGSNLDADGNALSTRTVTIDDSNSIDIDGSAAHGINSHAEGTQTLAYGNFSHAENYQTSAIANMSHAEGYGSKATGFISHAEGHDTVSSGNVGHAEGDTTTASGDTSHAEGLGTTASGSYSHAEGQSSVASGSYSHSEGFTSIASNVCSHAEGNSTKANGASTHTEGALTVANGAASHAEGGNFAGDGTMMGSISLKVDDSTSVLINGPVAHGINSHAEGTQTLAYGYSSHSEGFRTISSGQLSHAEGIGTKASNYASHVEGHYNTEMTTGGGDNNTVGTAFVIGNGTSSDVKSNAFSIQFNGVVKAKSTITGSTTADYAEFFEWLDKNPNEEDRVGYFVTLDGNKIRIATNKDDYILGVVSGEPFVLGNGDCDTWNGMFLRDEFRRTIYEPVPKMVEILDNEGNPTGKYEEVEGEFEGTRPKLNPEYDNTQVYISRFDRKEWAPVGMLGVLAVRHDSTAEVNGYVTVNENGIATACEKNAENAYRVIKSNTDSVVEIIFR